MSLMFEIYSTSQSYNLMCACEHEHDVFVLCMHIGVWTGFKLYYKVYYDLCLEQGPIHSNTLLESPPIKYMTTTSHGGMLAPALVAFILVSIGWSVTTANCLSTIHQHLLIYLEVHPAGLNADKKINWTVLFLVLQVLDGVSRINSLL